jgi:transcriptional regulator GlxA family with amidase domain
VADPDWRFSVIRYDPAVARPRSDRHLVVTLVGDYLPVFEMAVPCEVFGIARSEISGWRYEHVVAAVRPRPIPAGNGLLITPQAGLDALARADTVVIPGWSAPDRYVEPEVVEALRAAHRRGARLVSVCTGAFALAATGLLDGKRATTHWMYADELAARHPAISVDPTVLYVDEGSVLTSAGTAAGIDLCLHLVRCDLGAEAANTVARRMVVPPHRDGGQAQFVQTPVPEGADDDTLGPVLTWMAEHLRDPLTVDELAARAAMSPRTFARRFVELTGTTPIQWLLTQRVLRARTLLETTDLPVERVAHECGFSTGAGLRTHFQRVVGASPLAYRRTFREDLAS